MIYNIFDHVCLKFLFGVRFLEATLLPRSHFVSNFIDYEMIRKSSFSLQNIKDSCIFDVGPLSNFLIMSTLSLAVISWPVP